MSLDDCVGLLDADVLITAYRKYYGPDICPGYWEFLMHHLEAGQLLIIDRVYFEIKYPDDLVTWMKQVPKGALVNTSEPHVAEECGAILNWVSGNSDFKRAAKDEFARGADPWLIAFAKVNDLSVITNEVFEPNTRKRVKIPNVCQEFRVPYLDTYDMLRRLQARFDWLGEPAKGVVGRGVTWQDRLRLDFDEGESDD